MPQTVWGNVREFHIVWRVVTLPVMQLADTPRLSHTWPSPHSPRYVNCYSVSILLRVGGWVCLNTQYVSHLLSVVCSVVYPCFHLCECRLPPAEQRGYTSVFNALYRITSEEGVLTLWRVRVFPLTNIGLDSWIVSWYGKSEQWWWTPMQSTWCNSCRAVRLIGDVRNGSYRKCLSAAEKKCHLT